jgi:hypothetical protein
MSKRKSKAIASTATATAVSHMTDDDAASASGAAAAAEPSSLSPTKRQKLMPSPRTQPEKKPLLTAQDYLDEWDDEQDSYINFRLAGAFAAAAAGTDGQKWLINDLQLIVFSYLRIPKSDLELHVLGYIRQQFERQFPEVVPRREGTLSEAERFVLDDPKVAQICKRFTRVHAPLWSEKDHRESLAALGRVKWLSRWSPVKMSHSSFSTVLVVDDIIVPSLVPPFADHKPSELILMVSPLAPLVITSCIDPAEWGSSKRLLPFKRQQTWRPCVSVPISFEIDYRLHMDTQYGSEAERRHADAIRDLDLEDTSPSYNRHVVFASDPWDDYDDYNPDAFIGCDHVEGCLDSSMSNDHGAFDPILALKRSHVGPSYLISRVFSRFHLA